jgi:hypothetical protein
MTLFFILFFVTIIGRKYRVVRFTNDEVGYLVSLICVHGAVEEQVTRFQCYSHHIHSYILTQRDC